MKHRFFTAALFWGILFFGTENVMAEFTVSSMFSDNMVLQREMPVPVWGRGEAGAEVKVTVSGHVKTTKVDEDGTWRLTLDAMEAGGPFELSIECGEIKNTFDNVMVGEVWLCSGQSNMQWPVNMCHDHESELRNADNFSNIRLYLVPKNGTEKPLENVEAQWKKCSPESAGNFSAVAYFFARELAQNSSLKGVPIGLIDSSFGGTLVETWISPEILKNKFPNIELHDAMFGFKPGAMYNAMIAPVVPYGIRGALWYQGESNSDWPATYAALLTGLIKQWRTDFARPEMPFLIVQLPNMADTFEHLHFTWIREAQAEVAQTVPNTEMAVAIDTCNGYDLHPKHKREIAVRLALIARGTLYGEDVVWRGPHYKSHTFDGAVARVKFAGCKEGLVNNNCDGPLRGFSLAGDDNFFRYANAQINGDEVVLSHPQIPKPRYIRYAWEGDPDADLYNAQGLPAEPFRTDNLKPSGAEIYTYLPARKIETENYSAHVNSDGQLVSLKIAGEEFLAGQPDLPVGLPGSYFAGPWGPVRLILTEQLGPRILKVEIETGSVTYEFHDDSIQWALKNKHTEKVDFVFVMAKEVEAGTIDDGKKSAPPISGKGNAVTWHRSNAALRIEGAGEAHFPLNENLPFQTWKIPLEAGEEREIKLIAIMPKKTD